MISKIITQISFGILLSAAHVKAVCYDGETLSLLCYTSPENTSQNVTVADVTYIAGYLRAYGQTLKAGRFFTMTTVDAPDCDEWTLYARNSALAVAKHLDPSVNSSVLFEDIATTIDGGLDATDTQKQAAIIGCLADGGSLGVMVNSSNPSYSTSTYAASGYTHNGILIKIISNTT